MYNRVEEEDNTADNDIAVTAIQVSSKTTCIPRSMIEEEDNTANNDSANTAIQEYFYSR